MEKSLQAKNRFWPIVRFLFGAGGAYSTIAGYLSGTTAGDDTTKSIATIKEQWDMIPTNPFSLSLMIGGVIVIILSVLPYRRILRRRITSQNEKPQLAQKTLGERIANPFRNSAEAVAVFAGHAIPCRLSIEYNKNTHYTKHPNGFIEVRMQVKNDSSVAVSGIQVKIRSIIPLTKKTEMSPYTTQFNDVPLKFERADQGASLDPDETLEFRVVSANEKGGVFRFQSSECEYTTPSSGRIQLEIVATAPNATSDNKKFIIYMTRNGVLKFKPQETSCK